MATSTADETAREYPRSETDAAMLPRLVADALTASVSKLREDDEARMSQFTTTLQEFAAFREAEESRLARLEEAITSSKSPLINIDPTTNFWIVYNKVANEYDNDVISTYVGDLDTTLLFAGLFSAVSTAFIIQITPALQPNPADLTNVLLLRILLQNTSFEGSNPLGPISNTTPDFFIAQRLLFCSLSLTFFVAFFAVAGKQWILCYTRATKGGNTVRRGRERQVRFAALQKWKVLVIIDLLSIILQISLYIFFFGLFWYLADVDPITSIILFGLTFTGTILYSSTFPLAARRFGRPFQTPLFVLLMHLVECSRETWPLTKSLVGSFGRPTGRIATPNQVAEDSSTNDNHMTLSNPVFWRREQLFDSPIPEDTTSSAGIWLLENSADISAASAVTAVFSESQWPSHHHSTSTTLTRLHDTYTECLRAPKFDDSTRLKAAQSAAAYYVLYHTQLVWSSSKNLKTEVEKLPPDLPPDLFTHKYTEEWGGNDLFEYLLHTEDRSESVASARFLSYIAPYWFCGDSDSTIQSRPIRLEKLHKLIDVLESSEAFTPTTLTNCVLCVGAAMDFPLHPEDLVRVDKSEYLQLTFEKVVEHIHGMVLDGGRRNAFAATALGILLSLAKKPTFPSVDAAWITGLLQSASEGGMDHGTFVMFLRLRALRKEEDDIVAMESPLGQDHIHGQGLAGTVASETPTPEYDLFSTISKHVKTYSEQENGWQDDAVYGGLMAIRGIHQLGACLPEVSFLKTLSDAMKKSNAAEEDKRFRVRKAAYDVVLAAQDGWLRSTVLRQTLEELDFPRQLHSVVTETGHADRQRSFLVMMETLSQDRYWHPYLRRSMDVWLPFHDKPSPQVLRILSRVAEIPLPEDGSSYLLPDKPLVKLMEDEWAAVPARPVPDLTVDRLEPLVEITKKFKEMLFDESDRKAVLATVERVIPSLEKRCDDGYEGPGADFRGIIGGLVEVMRLPSPPSVSASAVDPTTDS